MTKRKELGIESEWLFPKINKDGTYINEKVEISTIDSWGESFNTILNKLGINEHFYWHSIRHAFTTNLLKQGLPESIVQQVIGWSSIDMVNCYDDRDTSEMLEQYFGEEGIKKVEQKGLNDL
jgi:site-specific recombinase XerD